MIKSYTQDYINDSRDFKMIKSYTQDYETDSKDWVSTIRFANNNNLLDLNNYYKGRNTTINNFKRYYYSDKNKRMVENKFVANNKIGYSFFSDMVNQKVNTLLDEAPNIDNIDDEKFITQLGYALKTAGIKSSICGYSFIFKSFDNKFKVFGAEETISYFDDNTSELKCLVRYWKIKDIIYYEVYNELGISLNGEEPTPYKYTIKKSILTEEIISEENGIIPIVMLRNNEDLKSDMTLNIRSKIDSIDLVQSGFANNIEDFSDLFWIIKDSNPQLNSDVYEDLIANISKGKKIFGENIDTKQVNIPTEARTKFVEILKADLFDETGVIDYKAMTGSSLTNVAIKAATIKLQQRVSSFEWFVYDAIQQLLLLSGYVDTDVRFTKLLIENKQEIVNHAIMVRGTISNRSYLNLLKQANIIDNVDEEIQEMENESNTRVSLNMNYEE